MDNSLKIARINLKAKQLETAKDILLAVIDNPAVELVAGTLLIESWAAADQGSWSSELVQGAIKTSLEVSLAAVCVAKAISPALNSPAASALVGKFLP